MGQALHKTTDAVQGIAGAYPADLYLLTGDETPFVQDGLRDGEHIRHEMHAWFMDALQKQDAPWELISGDQKSRVEQALSFISRQFSDI